VWKNVTVETGSVEPLLACETVPSAEDFEGSDELRIDGEDIAHLEQTTDDSILDSLDGWNRLKQRLSEKKTKKHSEKGGVACETVPNAKISKDLMNFQRRCQAK
jgi:hypothetical protein